MNESTSKLGLTFPFFVGPMVGISHVAFRALIRSYLPKGFPILLFTEMLSTRRLPNERLDSVEHLKTMENESGLIPQILGNEERFIAPSLKKLEALNPFAVDINMGCPVSHTLKHNWGVALMGDKEYASSVVAVTKRFCRVPVSVKLRAGLETYDLDKLVHFTDALEKAGANWMTIHARIKSQKHNGEANWEIVDELCRYRDVPIILNGNIQTYSQALELYHQTRVGGIMIGRAACARPWILAQIASQLHPDKVLREALPWSLEEEGRFFFESLVRYLFFLKRYFGETPYSSKRFVFYLSMATRWLTFGHSFQKQVMKARCFEEAETIIENYQREYAQPLRGSIDLFS